MYFINKVRSTLSIFVNHRMWVTQPSYYPEKERKSNLQIIADQLWLVWKYGVLENGYFLYGFDCKDMTRQRMEEEYVLTTHQFDWHIMHTSLVNPKYGIVAGRVLCQDKYYYSIFLEHMGMPSPTIYLYIKAKRPLYIAPRFNVDADLSSEEKLKVFFSRDMDAFAKPCDGMLGMGAFSLKITNGVIYVNGEETQMDKLISMILSDDYLVQECIYQHSALAALNASSINSIRMVTAMDKDGIPHYCVAGLRIGRKGVHVDNTSRGGMMVGITEDGKLMKYGYFKPEFGKKTTEHPDSHIVFEGYQIPYYKEAVEMALQIHSHLYRCHSIGWDIAITEKGPVFIEANDRWETRLLQTLHGGLNHKVGQYFDLQSEKGLTWWRKRLIRAASVNSEHKWTDK